MSKALMRKVYLSQGTNKNSPKSYIKMAITITIRPVGERKCGS